MPASRFRGQCGSFVSVLGPEVLAGESAILFEDSLGIQPDVPHLDHPQLVFEVLQQVCHLGIAAQAGNGADKNIAFLLHLIDYKRTTPNLL